MKVDDAQSQVTVHQKRVAELEVRRVQPAFSNANSLKHNSAIQIWFQGRSCLKVMQWNINGWSADSREGKKTVVEHLDADIISLCESHLEGNTEVQIEGYETFVHNRQLRNRNLNRTFGGSN